MPVYRNLQAVTGVLPLLLAVVVAAEPSDIERCAQAASMEARVECLEDAVRRLSGVEAVEATAGDVVLTPHSARSPQEATPMPEAPAESSAAPLPDKSRQELDRLGEEQLARRQEKRENGDQERLTAQVVDFDFVGRNKLRVTLRNGQVWVQNRSDRPNLYPRLRDLDGFSVEMWRTSQGSYRMYVPDANRTIRIERLQ